MYFNFFRTSLLIILNFFLIQSVGFSQSQFQGKVKIKMTDENGKSTTLNYLVKDKKFRMESPGDQGTIILDAGSGKMLMIMDEQKMYMEIPFDMKDMMSEETKKQEGNFMATGEKKEILGYTCEKFIYTDEDSKNEMWLTKEPGGFMFFNDPKELQGSANNWQTKLLSEGYFPMQVREMDNTGSAISTFEVQGLEKLELDNSLFTVPSGYQKFQMPNMNMEK